MTRSLHRDVKHAVEKEQAIKLIRAIVEIGSERRNSRSGTVRLSDPVMRAFIAVAEHTEDPFRPICIETLAEIRMYCHFLVHSPLIDTLLVEVSSDRYRSSSEDRRYTIPGTCTWRRSLGNGAKPRGDVPLYCRLTQDKSISPSWIGP